MYSILFTKLESDRRPDRSGSWTGAAAPGDCSSARRLTVAAEINARHAGRWDYFAEKASIGLSQQVVERRQVCQAKAASFASAQERVQTLTVGGGDEAVPGAVRVEQPADNH